jgi:hypothetical protein
VVYPWALLAAMRMRTVDWRGVAYEIRGPWDVRMLEYRPYGRPGPATNASATSL